MISVVIPNWNGEQHLCECLEALKNQTFQDFELVFVDNGSTDGSVEFVRNFWLAATIVELSDNLGFAAAVNHGIGAAQGEYISLLNNDTCVSPYWLENLHRAIVENPDIMIFASMLVNYYDHRRIDSAGDGFNLWLGPYKIGEAALVENYQTRRFIFGACGGAGCYKRELFDRIGMFDEDFFAYFEDVDFSFRANWLGFRCLLVPNAVVYHKVAATSGADRQRREMFDIMRRRNYAFLIVKNYPVSFLVQYLPVILIIHGIKLALNVCRCRFSVAFVTQWEILKGIFRMLEKRRKIMMRRSISNSEMKSRCTPDVAWD